jgi:hypothetical protein
MVRTRTANSPESIDWKSPVDIDILNFALTLEHLENTFYTQGLSKFTQADFMHAGFPDWSYGRLKQIAAHEAAHVKLLETTLGDKATKPCTYKLSVIFMPHCSCLMTDAVSSSPYDDPKSFVTLSHALEVVGKYHHVAARLVPHAILYTRGLGIHRCIKVFRK